MPRTLLVTNDFPPRAGGIQAYLHALAGRLPADELVVYTSSWPGAPGFDAGTAAREGHQVHRHPGPVLLPLPAVAARAAALAREYGCDSVWFGAAAPLARALSHRDLRRNRHADADLFQRSAGPP